MTAINLSHFSELIKSSLTFGKGVYLQSLLLIGCFAIAYVFYLLGKKFVLPKVLSVTLKKNPKLNRLITKYIVSLFYPLIAVIFLTLGLFFYGWFFEETEIFSSVIKLLLVFLFLRFLRIASSNNFITNAAGFFLVPTLLLDIFNLLGPVITYLDDYDFTIGQVRISVYLVIKSFIVLLVVFWASSLLSQKTRFYIENNKKIESGTRNLIAKFIDISIYLIAGIVLLKTLGVGLETLAIMGGAIGVGIGFGLQKIASNFISGIILLFEKSVELGDIIELENGKIVGAVRHFSSRYTLIEGWDGREILVPNEELIINKVANLTYSNNRSRIEIKVGVDYDSNLEQVREIMINCAKEHPRCVSYPDADCFITELDEYSVKFTLYFWVSDITAGKLGPQSDTIIAIWKKFKEHGIKIPAPRRDVKIESS